MFKVLHNLTIWPCGCVTPSSLTSTLYSSQGSLLFRPHMCSLIPCLPPQPLCPFRFKSHVFQKALAEAPPGLHCVTCLIYTSLRSSPSFIIDYSQFSEPQFPHLHYGIIIPTSQSYYEDQ